MGIVGDDFAPEDEAVLHEHDIDVEGIEKVAGKTFYWSGVYSKDMNERTTLTTELNVFADFDPKLPQSYRAAPYVFVANIHPGLQRSVYKQAKKPRFVGGDTMNFWIEGTPEELAATIKDWDFILINDSEARLLSGEYNLRLAAEKIRAMGPTTGRDQTRRVRRDSLSARRLFHCAGILARDGLRSHRSRRLLRRRLHVAILRNRASSDIGHATHPQLRKAMIYGSVMGSFCCEQFGVGRLRTLTREGIDERFDEFRRFTEF